MVRAWDSQLQGSCDDRGLRFGMPELRVAGCGFGYGDGEKHGRGCSGASAARRFGGARWMAARCTLGASESAASCPQQSQGRRDPAGRGEHRRPARGCVSGDQQLSLTARCRPMRTAIYRPHSRRRTRAGQCPPASPQTVGRRHPSGTTPRTCEQCTVVRALAGACAHRGDVFGDVFGAHQG